MGGFEIFENRTIVKSVLIETVLWGDPLYLNFPSNQKRYKQSDFFLHILKQPAAIQKTIQKY